jgi:hypothetical protein
VPMVFAQTITAENLTASYSTSVLGVSGSVSGSSVSYQSSCWDSVSCGTYFGYDTAVSVSGNTATGDLWVGASSGSYNGTAVNNDFASDGGTASASISYDVVVSNTTSSAQTYSFNFYLQEGSLALSLEGNQIYPESATNTLEILVNGVVVWQSSATLMWSSATGVVLSTAGADLGYTSSSGWPSSSSYVFSAYAGSVSLGALAAGESVTVTYLLVSSADADVTGEPAGYGGSVASLSDPVSVSGESAFSVSIAAVPEPNAYAMILSSLGLLGLLARRCSVV